MSSTKYQNYKNEKLQAGSETLTVGDEIDSGTEGAVYHIQEEHKTSVVKIFSEDRREQKLDKIQAMLDNQPDDPTMAEHGVRSIVWPEAIVKDANTGEFLGYKMPYRDLANAKDAYNHAILDLQWDKTDPEKRYTTALNLVLMVYAIHAEGHAIGDFNHDNILIDDGFVTLIDCDSFTISDGNTTYPGDTFYPRYTPPEGRPQKLEEVQDFDRFCLGVHIYQLLMSGFHPYQAKGTKATNGSSEDWISENKFPHDNTGYAPPNKAPNYEELPEALRSLFSECFSEAGKQNQGLLYGDSRPKPSQWINAFAKVLPDVDGFETSDDTQENDATLGIDYFSADNITEDDSQTISVTVKETVGIETENLSVELQIEGDDGVDVENQVLNAHELKNEHKEFTFDIGQLTPDNYTAVVTTEADNASKVIEYDNFEVTEVELDCTQYSNKTTKSNEQGDDGADVDLESDDGTSKVGRNGGKSEISSRRSKNRAPNQETVVVEESSRLKQWFGSNQTVGLFVNVIIGSAFVAAGALHIGWGEFVVLVGGVGLLFFGAIVGLLMFFGDRSGV